LTKINKTFEKKSLEVLRAMKYCEIRLLNSIRSMPRHTHKRASYEPTFFDLSSTENTKQNENKQKRKENKYFCGEFFIWDLVEDF
jgi:hypothetical protein